MTVSVAPFAFLTAQQDAGFAGTHINTSAIMSVDMTSPGNEELVNSMSTSDSRTYELPDGTFRTEAFSSVVNYRGDGGVWHPINNSLVEAPEADYAVENASNSYTAKIPDNPSATPVRFETGDGSWVAFRMHGLDASRPSVDGDTATLGLPEADGVLYQATDAGLKETITLAAPPTSSDLNYYYSIRTSPGLKPALEAGSIHFLRPDGSIAATIPQGTMSDSATPESATSDAVAYRIEDKGDYWLLRVTPDLGWLNSPEREYPVAIDPSIVNAPDSRDCTVKQELPSDNACGSATVYIRTGRSANLDERRGLLQFDVSGIPGNANVSAATAHLQLKASETTTGAPADYAMFEAGLSFDATATWNNSGMSGPWSGGDPIGSPVGTKSGMTGTTDGDKTFDVTSIVQRWIANTYPLTGLVVKQIGTPVKNAIAFYSDAATNAQSMRPVLEVTYSIAAEDPIDDAPEPTMTNYGVDQYELEDLTTVAADDGTTLQQAIDTYGWQDRFGDAVDQARAQYPDTFAGASLNTAGSPGGSVQFTTGVPVGASDLFASLPEPVALSSGAANTARDAATMAPVARDAIVQQLGVDSEVSVSLNTGTGELAVDAYSPNPSPSASELAAIAKAAVVNSAPSAAAPSVEVSIAASPDMVQPTMLRGGATLTSASGTKCTSGFPVRTTSGSQTGLLEARHCANDMNTYQPSGSPARNRLANASKFLSTSYGDMQYQENNSTSLEKTGHGFYAGYSTVRKLKGIFYPVANSKVCMYGRTTNVKKCGKLYDFNVSVHYNNGGWDFDGLNVVGITEHPLTQKGDSGGPVFWKGKAVGLISGLRRVSTTSGDPKWMTFYSPIGYVSKMGLELNLPSS